MKGCGYDDAEIYRPGIEIKHNDTKCLWIKWVRYFSHTLFKTCERISSDTADIGPVNVINWGTVCYLEDWRLLHNSKLSKFLNLKCMNLAKPMKKINVLEIHIYTLRLIPQYYHINDIVIK